MENKLSNRQLNTIIFTQEDGKDIEYEILATIKSISNKKIYYIMTDHKRSINNELNITMYYINYDDSSKFYPVTDDREINIVYDYFIKNIGGLNNEE